MNAGTVLIADDHLERVREVKLQLARLGLESLWTSGGRGAIQLFLHRLPDAVILGETLTDFNVWETAELIRAVRDVPIVFLADRLDRLSRNRALQLGDEYLAPPWQWDLLRARLAALLKRASGPTNALTDAYNDGYLKVDISGLAVTRAGTPVDLSHTEFKLLSCFVRHPNVTLSHFEILHSIWGYTYPKAKTDVTLYVYHLRRKIELSPSRPAYLQTVRGVGYLFASHQ